LEKLAAPAGCGTCRPTEDGRSRAPTCHAAAADGTLSGELTRSPPRARHSCGGSAKGVARFTFGQLLRQPLGAGDYLRIAHEFHTIILDGIPVMDFSSATRRSVSSR